MPRYCRARTDRQGRATAALAHISPRRNLASTDFAEPWHLDASSSQTRCTNGKTCERRRREVSGGVLAAVLKCSRVYVRELTASGVLTRNKAGYLLRPNVGAYVEHLRRERGQDLSPRSEAAAEHHRLRAQMVALQIATHEKRYVPVECTSP